MPSRRQTRHFGPRSLATLDPPSLPRANPVVGLRSHVTHAEDLEAGGLERADRGLAAGARAVHGQAAPVADAPVGADLRQPLDRLRALAAQVALDLQVRVDVVAELRDLLVGEVAHLRVLREPERGADLARGRGPDAVDVGQP